MAQHRDSVYQLSFPGSFFLNSVPILILSSNPLAKFVPSVSKIYLGSAPAPHPLQRPSSSSLLVQLQRLLPALLAP